MPIPGGAGLRAALGSCSYKKEVILLTTTENVLDNALQFHNSLLRIGFAHTILLVDKASAW